MVMGGDSYYKGRGFESWHRILIGHLKWYLGYVGSNPGTVYLLDIFHIYLLLKTYFFKKREYSDHWTTTAS